MEVVYVALIGGPLMWILGMIGRRLDRKLTEFDERNTSQHATSVEMLEEIREDVRETRNHLADHLKWHAHKEADR